MKAKKEQRKKVKKNLDFKKTITFEQDSGKYQ